MYEKVPSDMNFAAREEAVLEFWKERGVFEKSIKQRERGGVFTFYDGPPTANGAPHMGHVITRAYKDCVPRYKTMKGYAVARKAGWDTHGLPVELEVEKKLGISGKPDIEKYGVEPFIKLCKESVWKYEKEWREMSERVGFWADMDAPYITYNNDYIESVWWALSQIWGKKAPGGGDMLYKGHKTVPYCPRCGTALSSHEVAQGYKDVKEKSVFARFKIDGGDGYFLAWTTTPWTLPSNVALCVNPNEEYVKINAGGTAYILAGALCGSLFKDAKTEGGEIVKGFEVIERYKGKELEGKIYEPLFDFQRGDYEGNKNGAFRIVCDDYVTLTDGSGIVHIAPAFGEDDNRVGQKYGLPFIQRVDAAGHMTEDSGIFAGKFVKDADKLVIKDLNERGLLFAAIDFEHSYPFCWRCDTPLIYYARDAWFIRMSAMRGHMAANNNTVNWYPDNIKEGRFGNWLENAVDWGISRERYWGTPLPIWECECGHKHCVGSRDELSERAASPLPPDLELHKPYIDNVSITCEKCAKPMKRVSEVIDCWFDSGSMPFAQWHYPFENKEIFDANFPADFISEAIDQTRGWFYTLMAISTLLFDKSPFKNCVVLGHVQDKHGQKMSKHTGNGVSPQDALAAHGADAVRWYFYTSSQPWLPTRFSAEAVAESSRKFMGTLWNSYAFYVLYANIDKFDELKGASRSADLCAMDRWLVSKLNTLIKDVDENMECYRITEAARALSDFTDELSNWYVRRCRDRFWAGGMEQDKIDAYITLKEALLTVSKLSAPFTPFIAEQIYQNLETGGDKRESVHLCDFPAADESLTDKRLEEEMGATRRVVELGRAARNEANIKNRQPLAELFAAGVKIGGEFADIIKEELNVGKVTIVEDAGKFSGYKFKPQLKTLGPRYGKLLGKISAHLSAVDGAAFMAELQGGAAKFDVGGVNVELTIDDVLVESAKVEGYASASDGGVTAALDTRLTEALIEEGFVREIISKIQTMRKEAGFEVTDRINIACGTSPRLSAVLVKNTAPIKAQTLADSLGISNEAGGGLSGGYSKEWDINGEKAVIAVVKANA